MLPYESIFLVRHDASMQNVLSIKNNIITLIETHGGKVLRDLYCGLLPLSYTIKKSKKGHYVMIWFKAPSSFLATLCKYYRINESDNIMRFLTVRVKNIDMETIPPFCKLQNIEQTSTSSSQESYKKTPYIAKTHH